MHEGPLGPYLIPMKCTSKLCLTDSGVADPACCGLQPMAGERQIIPRKSRPNIVNAICDSERDIDALDEVIWQL